MSSSKEIVIIERPLPTSTCRILIFAIGGQHYFHKAHADRPIRIYIIEGEVNFLQSVHCDGIPKLYTPDFTLEGRTGVAMEYIPSITMIKMKRGLQTDSALVDAILDVLVILGEIHTHGFIHGDISPANIIYDTNGKIFLVDFELSHRISTRLVKGGHLMFRPLEECRAEPRYDLYCLVATILFLKLKSDIPYFLEQASRTIDGAWRKFVFDIIDDQDHPALESCATFRAHLLKFAKEKLGL